MKKTMTTVAYKLLGTSVLAAALIGCGGTQENSETKVTNGRDISEDVYPSVVLLVMQLAEGQAICTGTFVNDSQVITAGHCVEGLNESDPSLYLVSKKREGNEDKFYAKAKAVSYKRNPYYDISLGVSPYDVAVVSFPANSAPAVSKRATRAPSAGQTLTIVGYGNNVNSLDDQGQMTGSGAGSKRIGTNTVSAVSGGFISFDGLAGADGVTSAGELVSSGSGDSGGPLFVNGQLAGITSGGGLRSDGDGGYYATSRYVDLNSAYVKSFVTSALKN